MCRGSPATRHLLCCLIGLPGLWLDVPGEGSADTHDRTQDTQVVQFITEIYPVYIQTATQPKTQYSSVEEWKTHGGGGVWTARRANHSLAHSQTPSRDPVCCLQFTVWRVVQCAVCTVHCSVLGIVQCEIFTVQCRVKFAVHCIVGCKVCSVECAV